MNYVFNININKNKKYRLNKIKNKLNIFFSFYFF